jgi:hypothetical protein
MARLRIFQPSFRKEFVKITLSIETIGRMHKLIKTSTYAQKYLTHRLVML